MSLFPTGSFNSLREAAANATSQIEQAKNISNNILDKLICEAYILYEVRNILEAFMPKNRLSPLSSYLIVDQQSVGSP